MTTNGDVNKLIWLQFLGTISCHGKTKKQLEKKDQFWFPGLTPFQKKMTRIFWRTLYYQNEWPAPLLIAASKKA